MNRRHAWWAVRAAAVAYETEAAGLALATAYGFVAYRYIEVGDSQAVIVETPEGAVYAVIRGTQFRVRRSWSDIFTNGFCDQVPWIYGGHVAAGYLAHAERLIEALARALAGARDVIIGGHSMGGAVALPLARRLDAAGVITFGAPRFGDSAFAAEFRAWLGESLAWHMRFVNRGDPAPAFPFGGVVAGSKPQRGAGWAHDCPAIPIRGGGVFLGAHDIERYIRGVDRWMATGEVGHYLL
ncbi:lipase family protein [Oceanibacterium hippocampi]|uniref:Lipase (Class 3) n=1 Tax=Oceanibacterium hippocampi TaxID=745714 RepID=A0A1Y5SZ61_9PROT|nr:hypothetical protein [Oceanibacterium hippocampi]SLN50249.1 Lipase (class 3) [Oceanibacterium hippocampi]